MNHTQATHLTQKENIARVVKFSLFPFGCRAPPLPWRPWAARMIVAKECIDPMKK